MVKCPHCKAEINYLNYCIDKTTGGTFSVDKSGFEEYDEDYSDIREEEYFCPECGKEISSINVYDFLKGEIKMKTNNQLENTNTPVKVTDRSKVDNIK